MGNTTQYFGGFNSGINLGAWRLRHNSSYTRTDGGNNTGHYQAISSYAQRSIAPLRAQFSVGQYFTPGDQFDSVPFTGVQLTSDSRMNPDTENGFAPVIRGIANSNAKVTVRQGNNVIHETSVPPGPFAIDDLHSTGYSGDLLVTVTEADGQTRSFTVAYAAVPQMRNGVLKGPTPNTASPDTVRAMTPEMFFDYLAVHINGEKAGKAKAVFNIDLGNDGGKYKLELENGVLNHTANAAAKEADATITLDRATLNKIILKEETLKQAEDKGEVKVSGNGAKLEEMLGYMDKFEFWFNIVTP
ncbi:fimbria/pilus outer membrane usher protein [Serratia sp. H1n]|uniref:fimbria/pilus outer membrane usher protein n=1 Tax=unclassified Serratia (in: enterobacteria) TaxID=2647522 RepID=UPI00351060E6